MRPSTSLSHLRLTYFSPAESQASDAQATYNEAYTALTEGDYATANQLYTEATEDRGLQRDALNMAHANFQQGLAATKNPIPKALEK